MTLSKETLASIDRLKQLTANMYEEHQVLSKLIEADTGNVLSVCEPCCNTYTQLTKHVMGEHVSMQDAWNAIKELSDVGSMCITHRDKDNTHVHMSMHSRSMCIVLDTNELKQIRYSDQVLAQLFIVQNCESEETK